MIVIEQTLTIASNGKVSSVSNPITLQPLK